MYLNNMKINADIRYQDIVWNLHQNPINSFWDKFSTELCTVFHVEIEISFPTQSAEAVEYTNLHSAEG